MTRFVYVAHLEGLEPMSVYELWAGDWEEGEDGMSEKFLIRTLPYEYKEDQDDDNNPIRSTRLIVGGDVGMSDEAVKLFELAVDVYPLPHAMVIGGDLAYENAITTCYRRFDEWLYEFTSSSQSKGMLIPVIPVVGNHDAGGFARKTYGAEALYFYYFPYLINTDFESEEETKRRIESKEIIRKPATWTRDEENRKAGFVPISGEGVVVFEDGWTLKEETYRVHDIESCSLSIFVLDSNHVFSPESQVDWLEQELQNRTNANTLFKVTAYHDPMFPSQLWEYPNVGRKNLRDSWFESFGKYGVDVGFEFHTHEYKRSRPLLSAKLKDGNEENWVVSEEDESLLVPKSDDADISKGTVFIGDGCMGVEAHGDIQNLKLPFYLEKAISEPHFLVADFDPWSKGIVVKAEGVNGEYFDSYSS
eukprot:CAMPEP_0201533848 /NCGR_PEP_ID=MMETSP0161_2-20130828/54520_1 /ASSEMBLY_ACC=CAM_ASM_000251 /TAXON_ID=180227 /ORGANISM="Neoparamoeba aestuarina, Strain SoJaBio B1-5/56/2" /LENGTH=418 /DNA_ID=CAMNT_0047938139 /DNA_START=38 /DNA_END=1294 /DNA_ORIENTATION=+